MLVFLLQLYSFPLCLCLATQLGKCICMITCLSMNDVSDPFKCKYQISVQWWNSWKCWCVNCGWKELVLQDIDCMPLHPLENFPESLRHQSAINGYYSHLSEAKYEDQMKELASGGAARSTSNLNGTDATFYTPSGHPMSTLMKQAKVACSMWKLFTFL